MDASNTPLALINNPPKLTNDGSCWWHIELWLGSEGTYIKDQSYTDQTEAMKAMAQAFEDHALCIADLMDRAPRMDELTMAQVLELDTKAGM